MSCYNTFSELESTSPDHIFFFLTRNIFYHFPGRVPSHFSKTIIILFNNGGFYGRTKNAKGTRTFIS